MLNTKEEKIGSYIELLSSKNPIPGGGGVAALNAALSAALISMVCNLTIGKKKFLEIEEKIIEIRERAVKKHQSFLELADEDAKVFLPLSKAYSLKSNSDEERKKKEEIIEPLLLSAALVPLKVMTESFSLIDDLEFLLNNSSNLAISDVGAAALNLQNAISCAILNVKINTKYMTDKYKKEEIEEKAKKIIDLATYRLSSIYKNVLEVL